MKYDCDDGMRCPLDREERIQADYTQADEHRNITLEDC